MAGIYIHIPFCRQKCYYCDFYKTVNTDQSGRFVSALVKEISLQSNIFDSEIIDTIYFGGGTPSVLNGSQLSEIFQTLRSLFPVAPDAEITFEANPDDLDSSYLEMLRENSINRLSIGIQSFNDNMLKKMNRRHNASQSADSVLLAQKAGFTNISIDLIFGLPELTASEWIENLDIAFQLPAQHLSAYHLTYHEGTPFYTWLKKGTLRELEEDESLSQFNILIDKAEGAGFEHYEISNFARSGMYSRHNTSYWSGIKYLGLGPSAHSYTGSARRWNIPHLESYLKAIEKGNLNFEEELLTQADHFNEYILTRIRTMWGISESYMNEHFGTEIMSQFNEMAARYIERKLITRQDNCYRLTRKGLFVSDEITANLMII